MMVRPQRLPLSDSGALVVEDEPRVRTFAAKVLMDAGYRVFEACNASEALIILYDRRNIRVFLVDIEKPGAMNGLALVGTIRNQWPDIVVMVHSGRVHPDKDALPIDALIEQLAGVTLLTDDDILETWHADELARAAAPEAEKLSALTRLVPAEQVALRRFGLGPHDTAFDDRFCDEPGQEQ